MAITSKETLNRVHNEGLGALTGGMPPGISAGMTPAGYRDLLASGQQSALTRLAELVPDPAPKLGLHFNTVAPDSPTRITPTFDLKNTL